jgi:acyl-CoA synthetase (AMP-forming)/AMP-acid ligase II
VDFGGALRKSAVQFRDRPATYFEGETQTYRELWERACRVANGLLSLGLRPGDRVATLGDNAAESVEMMCGLALAGLVRCPMYVHNTTEIHTYMMGAVGARAVVVQQAHLDALGDSLAGVETLDHLVVTGGEDLPAGVIAYEALVGVSRAKDPAVQRRGSDPYIIRFSAGTTGRPKGILHTYDGWAAMGQEFVLALPRFDEEDSYLVAGPLSHAACLLSWPMITYGVRQVVMPRFNAGRFLDLVEQQRATLSLLVPTMIQLIVNHPSAPERDLSSLKAIYYGASPITSRTLSDAHRLWGPIMHQLYGQSETPAITVLPASLHRPDGTDAERALLRSAGRPTPNVRVKIVDDDGNAVPTGELGEVAALGPANMAGIWGDDTATAARLTDDGYIRTGDIGYLDERGFLFLADRKEDLIISGGFNVWPAEVEDALCAHPAVLEAAVIGVPDEKWGETVLAVVVLREGKAATPRELISWCRDRIGPVKKPTRIEFSTDPLPKSGVGKLLRRSVRERYWQGRDRLIGGA